MQLGGERAHDRLGRAAKAMLLEPRDHERAVAIEHEELARQLVGRLDAEVGHSGIDATLVLGMGIQSNQGRLEREGPFFPNHGLERIVAFHDRQDSRYVEVALAASVAAQKPVLIASELAIADPTNAAVTAVREAKRYCFPSAERAVRTLHFLYERERWLESFATDSPISN